MYDLKNIKLNFLKNTAKRIPDVLDSDYFGEAYKEGISNSLLKLINPEEGGSPVKFLEGFDKTPKSALQLGTAVHQMVLENDKHFLSPVDKPSGKVGAIMDTYFQFMRVPNADPAKMLVLACEEHEYYTGKLTEKRLSEVLSKGKEYFDFLCLQINTPGCIILTEQEKEKLNGCVDSVENNKLVMDLLEPPTEIIDEVTGETITLDIKSYNEDVMTMEVEAIFGDTDDDDEFFKESIKATLKCKIDNWSIDFTNKILTLNDLKTTGSPINEFPGYVLEGTNLNGEPFKYQMKGSFQKFHYYRQMAMYMFILKSYAEIEYGVDDTWTFKTNMLVVQTNKPYTSHVFTIGYRWLTFGHNEFEDLLKRVLYHRHNGFDKFIEMDLDSPTSIV